MGKVTAIGEYRAHPPSQAPELHPVQRPTHGGAQQPGVRAVKWTCTLTPPRKDAMEPLSGPLKLFSSAKGTPAFCLLYNFGVMVELGSHIAQGNLKLAR